MMGDPYLAALNKKYGIKSRREKIVRTDHLATVLNREQLGSDMMRRIVDLSCGHKAVTKNLKSMRCPTCQAMIDNGEDYDGYINHGIEIDGYDAFGPLELKRPEGAE